jgi:hypothetical protein
MAFPVSPAVVVREFDLTTVIPAVALTPACLAGVFAWGPLQTIITVQSEPQQLQQFGPPSDLNAETWFSGANFLAYGGVLKIARAGDGSGSNAESYFSSSAGVNIFTGNTSGITNGMVLFYSNAASAADPSANGAVTVTSVAGGTITLSVDAAANVANANFFFRDNKLYTAVAQESPTPKIAWSQHNVLNDIDYLTRDGSFDASVQYLARFPGKLGNSLRISVCDSPNTYSRTLNVLGDVNQIASNSAISANVGSNTVTFTVTALTLGNTTHIAYANTTANNLKASIAVGDLLQLGNVAIGYQTLKVTKTSAVANNDATGSYSFTVQTDQTFNLSQNFTTTQIMKYWEFANVISKPPGVSAFQSTFGNSSVVDELHVVVVDQKGLFTGVPGVILEKYQALSRAKDATLEGDQPNWYKTVINKQSQYIRWARDRALAVSNTAVFLTPSTTSAAYNVQFGGGADGPSEKEVPISQLTNAYDLFADAVNVDVGLVITGKARGIPLNSNTQLATYLINNIAEARKDCVVFCSPDINTVVNNRGYEAAGIVTARNTMPSSSYAFMDSGYKLQYDKYNSVYRWIPLNGDIAGLATQTDATNNPWWSFAGFNRGNVKNVTKLAWNPKQSERDTLYSAEVNSVVTFPGTGTVLFGDKTMLAKPSAFNRINVRRLFIVLEKAIATAAKFTMFEFNDDFTRSQFRSMIKPFLTDVKAQRGLTDFLVVCDATNNTPQVVVNNQFKAAIYIKPNYAINWVILDFVAVPPTVQFSEVIGNYGG